MLRKNIAPEIKTNIDINSDEFIHNKNVMLKKINFLDELLDKAELGGGAYHHERLAKRGKMPVRERVFNLLDPDTPLPRDCSICCLRNRLYCGRRMCSWNWNCCWY